MTHWRMTSRPASGAQLPGGSLCGDTLPRLPSESVLPYEPASPALKRSNALQAFIDILAVSICLFVVCATAASLPLALFLLFFVKT